MDNNSLFDEDGYFRNFAVQREPEIINLEEDEEERALGSILNINKNNSDSNKSHPIKAAPSSQAPPPPMNIEAMLAEALSGKKLAGVTPYRRDEDKSKATHHQLNFAHHFYKIPEDKELAMMDEIIVHYLNSAPECVCEHLREGLKCRAFLDIDLPEGGLDIERYLPEIAVEACKFFRKTFPIATLDRFRALVPASLQAKFGIIFDKNNQDSLFLVPSISSNHCPGQPRSKSYHLIWPYIFLSKSQKADFLSHIRESQKENIPTSKIEMPPTLRMPFCDRTENHGNARGMDLAGRPYTFDAFYSAKGDKINIDSLDYPIAECVTRDRRNFSLAIMVLSSLRVPYLVGWPKENTLLLEPPDVRSLRDEKSSATEWANSPDIFDPQDLHDLLQSLESASSVEQHEAVIGFMNRHIAQCHCGDYAFVVKALDTENNNAIKLDFITESQAKLKFGISIRLKAPIDPEDEEQQAEQLANVQARGRRIGRPKQKFINKSAFEIWVKNYQHRLILGLMFEADPDKIAAASKQVLNLYKGLAISREEAEKHSRHVHGEIGISCFFDHIWNVIAAKNMELFLYVLKWLAWCIQRPTTQTEVALMVSGREGCGKSMIGVIMQKIMGQSCVTYTGIDSVVSRFNSDLQDKCTVVVNEVEKMDTQTNALFRGFITDEKKVFEQKFHSRTVTRHPLNFFLTTNRPNDKTMDVSAQARRFCICSCRAYSVLTSDYFQKIFNWLESEGGAGYKCIAHFLYHINLRGFNPRIIPVTEGLLTQKLVNMSKNHCFFFECMQTGEIYMTQSRDGHSEFYGGRWDTEESLPLKVPQEHLGIIYREFCHNNHIPPDSINSLVISLKCLIPEIQITEEQEVFNRSMPATDPNSTEPVVVQRVLRIVTMITFPCLKDCYDAFFKHYTNLDQLQNLCNHPDSIWGDFPDFPNEFFLN